VAVEIGRHTTIPESELEFKTSRSGGPGGQNVNKLETRVTVLFDVDRSPSLSDGQKRRIRKRLSTRIDKRGCLHVVSQKHRSQEANRQAAVERLGQLLRDALKRKPVRKKTKPTAGSRERRLKKKKERSRLKQQRSKKNVREGWE
jgi:ribosome-associated protein